MDLNELLQTAKKYLGGGRWMWVVAAVALVVVIAIPATLLWPVIRPKPAPQFMQVPSSAGATQTAQPAILPAVPAEVIEEIASRLNVDNPSLLSCSYQGDTDHIAVTHVVGAGNFKRYAFVKGEDGTWSRQ